MNVDRNTEPDRFDREYDFSRGVRGKYAHRFADRPAWLQAAAEHDVRRELGETLLKLQQFEAWLVAYHTLVLDLKPSDAGQAARKLLEHPAAKRSASFWKRFFQTTPNASDLQPNLRRELQELLHERSWVVHRSFHDVQGASPRALASVMDRLEQLSARADFLRLQIYRNVVIRCAQTGSSELQVQERAKKAIEDWVAA